jgi:hypothetical protein
VVGALASKTSTPADAAEMIRTLQRTGLDGTRFTSAASILESSGGVRDLAMMGGSLVFAIFGERTNAVTDWLASRAGIGRRSSLSLLTHLIPLIVNVVSMQAAGNGSLNAESLAGLLTGQSGHLRPRLLLDWPWRSGQNSSDAPRSWLRLQKPGRVASAERSGRWCWRFWRWRRRPPARATRRYVIHADGHQFTSALEAVILRLGYLPTSTWRRSAHRRAQRAVALAMFEYGDLPAALDAETR